MHNDAIYKNQWFDVLELLSSTEAVHGIIQGNATRLLFDSQILPIEEAAKKMSFALSQGAEVQKAAGWLEGFLHGSGLLLIHNPALWTIIDGWISGLIVDNFQELLPLLRRTFSSFSQPEREKMLQIAKKGHDAVTLLQNKSKWDLERIKIMVPTLKLLLGQD